ncbi:MAG: DUF4174 domain-containing protein [Alteromonadaceae bacterium]|nr:DUF4174 domain-containing protein [Alteromonadaceae bacterium]
MSINPITCTLLMLSLILISLDVESNELRSYQWKKRILVIDLKTIEDEQRFMREVREVIDEYLDRKLMLIFANSTYSEFPHQISKPWLAQLVEAQQANFILIGLDGGVKKTYSRTTFSHQRLFDVIDGMPMRKAEIWGN